MKHVKFLLAFVILGTALVYTYRSTCATAKEKGPGFELRNQSPLNIMFRFFAKGKKIADARIAPGNVYQWEIDLNDPLVVEVYEPSTRNVLNRIKIDAKGKTKYIAWNPAKYKKPTQYFYPQSGPDILSPDVSSSRFNLDNNIEQSDIKRIG